MLRCLIAALGALLVVPAVASAESESVTSGATTATLTWSGPATDVKDAKLTITRAGVVAFDQGISEVACDGCSLPGNGADDVKLVDLDGLGEPEVLVTAVNGQSPQTGIYSYDALAATYDPLEFLSTGFNLDDLDGDGRPEIIAEDFRIGVLVEDFTSLIPPRVVIFTRQDDTPVLADVTTKYTRLIKPQASRAKRALAKARTVNERLALLTVYIADEYLLGHGSTGLKEYDRFAKQRKLGRDAKRYRSDLLKLLKEYGYR